MVDLARSFPPESPSRVPYLKERGDFNKGQKVFAKRSKHSDDRSMKIFEIATIISISYENSSGDGPIDKGKRSSEHEDINQNRNEIQNLKEYDENCHSIQSMNKVPTEKRYDIMFQSDKQCLLNLHHSAIKNSHQCIFWRLQRPEFVKHRGKSLIDKYLPAEVRAETEEDKGAVKSNINISSCDMGISDDFQKKDTDDVKKYNTFQNYSSSSLSTGPICSPHLISSITLPKSTEYVPSYSSGDLLLPSSSTTATANASQSATYACPKSVPYVATDRSENQSSQHLESMTSVKKDYKSGDYVAFRKSESYNPSSSTNDDCVSNVGNKSFSAQRGECQYTQSYASAECLFDYQSNYVPSTSTFLFAPQLSSSPSSSSKKCNLKADKDGKRSSTSHSSQSSDYNHIDDYFNYDNYRRHVQISDRDASNLFTSSGRTSVEHGSGICRNIDATSADTERKSAFEYVTSYSSAELLFDYRTSYNPSDSSSPLIQTATTPGAGKAHTISDGNLAHTVNSQSKSSRNNNRKNRARSRSEDLSRKGIQPSVPIEAAIFSKIKGCLENEEELFCQSTVSTAAPTGQHKILEIERTKNGIALDDIFDQYSNQSTSSQPSTNCPGSKSVVGAESVRIDSLPLPGPTTKIKAEMKMRKPVTRRKRSGSAGFFNSISQIISSPLKESDDIPSEQNKYVSSSSPAISNTSTNTIKNMHHFDSISGSHFSTCRLQHHNPTAVVCPIAAPVSAVARVPASRAPPLSADSLSAFSGK